MRRPAGEVVRTPWRLVLLGAPGVGKGTQADLLNRRTARLPSFNGRRFSRGGEPDASASRVRR